MPLSPAGGAPNLPRLTEEDTEGQGGWVTQQVTGPLDESGLSVTT